MAPSVSFIGFSFLLILTATQALDIVKELKAFPQFSTFNQKLQETKITGEINKRKTITILGVNNANMGPVEGKNINELRRIMMTHVLLDYYDEYKLKELANNDSVTTLYQTSGTAEGSQGFLRVNNKKGQIFFGQVPFVQEVATSPYTISLLEVSSPIKPGGEAINGTTSGTPSGAQAPKASSATAPSPSGSKNATAPSPADAPADAPSDEADAPADAPEADAPTPVEAPADAPADEPASDEAAPADAPAADDKSGAPSVGVAFAAMSMMILSSSSWILM